MKAAAKLLGVALLALLAAIGALAVALAAMLHAAPGEWAHGVTIGPWQLRLSVPSMLRMATHPLGLRLLAGHSIDTSHGRFRTQTGADDHALTIVCDPCTPHHPRLGPAPLRLPRTELRLVRAGQTRLHGEIVSGALAARWEARLAPRGADIALHLPDTPISDLYALFADAIPEAARARIEGRAGADLRLSLPSGAWHLQPRIEGFAVSGLDTDALIGAAARPACSVFEVRREGAMPRFGAWLPRAVVAAEDQRFHEHAGLDLVEMRAAWQSGEGAGAGAAQARGASTLSQQLAKLLFTGSDRSAVRKLREALYAVELDRVLGKARVLQLYLRVAPWGEGRCGAHAASWHLLNKPAAALTPLEAAWLASLLRNPDAVLAAFAARGAIDRDRVGAVIEAMRPVPKSRRAAWQAQLEAWTPAVRGSNRVPGNAP